MIMWIRFEFESNDSTMPNGWEQKWGKYVVPKKLHENMLRTGLK